MSENAVAKTLRVIGVVIVICGIILGTIVMVENVFLLGLAIMISSFITCMLFVGFGEIIELLQNIFEKQDRAIAAINAIKLTAPAPVTQNKKPAKSELQDIEANLPTL